MLEDITAIVSGGSQGIGREICLSLADQGANVTIAARSDGIYETAELIGNEDKTVAATTDVTDPDSVESTIEETIDTFGSIDCLVNNAGIAGPTDPIEDIDPAEWRKTMDVNVTGMFLMTKYAIPYLASGDRSSIVNISSISGKRPLVNRTPYTSSKMAVIGFTRTAAFELGDEGITVNAICPGSVEGPRLDDVIRKQADKMDVSFDTAKQRLFLDDIALDSIVEASDVAEIVVYLAGPHGRQITAQDINVDSGATWY